MSESRVKFYPNIHALIVEFRFSAPRSSNTAGHELSTILCCRCVTTSDLLSVGASRCDVCFRESENWKSAKSKRESNIIIIII